MLILKIAILAALCWNLHHHCLHPERRYCEHHLLEDHLQLPLKNQTKLTCDIAESASLAELAAILALSGD